MASFESTSGASETGYLNNPAASLDRSIPVGKPITDVEFVLRVQEVCCTIVQNWQDDKTHFAISELSGGITNALYIVENTKRAEKVIVRVFGVGTDLFIDRGIENEVFAYLSSNDMGPIFHGLFANGRVEGFLNARNLAPNEFSNLKITEGIATTMAKLHSQKIVLSRDSSVWAKMFHIFTLLEGVRFQSHSQQRTLEFLNIPRLKQMAEALHAEFTSCEQTLLATEKTEDSGYYQHGQQFAFQTVFTHNDLLSGNVLIPLDYFERVGVDSIRFIDYEYAGYGTRAFDVANHFCEYAGFDFDMDADFPSGDQRLKFVNHYIGECRRNEQDKVAICDMNAIEFSYGFENIVLKHVLMSHLFWGVWATLQASMSTIDFDFMDYAKKRVTSFHKHYETFR